jgi:hypothetical protein
MRVRAIWQDYQVALLIEYYPNETAAHVAVLTDKNLLQVYRKAAQLGLKKSEEFKNSHQSGRVLKGKMSEAMKATQFKPGQVSWNKGRKGLPSLSPQTTFKKGNTPANTLPIGSYRIVTDSSNGRKTLELKINDLPGRASIRWKPYHRLVWEQAHGPIPEKMVIRFKVQPPPLDPDQITIDILEMVSQADNRRMNSLWEVMPKELAQLSQLRGALNRKINSTRRKNAK